MAVNTDEEPVDNLPKTQSEKPSEEIIPIKETETINPNQEIKNMEVHHHAHDPAVPHHKKNWKSYFWEFLMLFLAVFCGFLAESYHTHLINKDIEKRNIESFIMNVQKDSINLVNSIKQNQDKIELISLLAKIPGEFTDTSFQRQFFYYLQQLNYSDGYLPDESAFLQMQSSGTLRLINKQNITDSILKYQNYNHVIKVQQEAVNTSLQLSLENILQVIDLRALVNQTPLKFNGNYQQVQNYINHQVGLSIQARNYIGILEVQLFNIKNLLPYLKKEYNIKE